jgi:hypothetical protein
MSRQSFFATTTTMTTTMTTTTTTTTTTATTTTTTTTAKTTAAATGHVTTPLRKQLKGGCLFSRHSRTEDTGQSIERFGDVTITCASSRSHSGTDALLAAGPRLAPADRASPAAPRTRRRRAGPGIAARSRLPSTAGACCRHRPAPCPSEWDCEVPKSTSFGAANAAPEAQQDGRLDVSVDHGRRQPVQVLQAERHLGQAAKPPFRLTRQPARPPPPPTQTASVLVDEKESPGLPVARNGATVVAVAPPPSPACVAGGSRREFLLQSLSHSQTAGGSRCFDVERAQQVPERRGRHTAAAAAVSKEIRGPHACRRKKTAATCWRRAHIVLVCCCRQSSGASGESSARRPTGADRHTVSAYMHHRRFSHLHASSGSSHEVVSLGAWAAAAVPSSSSCRPPLCKHERASRGLFRCG